MTIAQHWNKVFATKNEQEVSWFQPYPSTSMAFVHEFKLQPNAHIIDIGGGDSQFADALIDKGFMDIEVLDISANAISRAKKRLGQKASLVKWITMDVTEFEPSGQYDFWHDRAAFHFLTDETKIKKYVAIATRAVRPGGYLVLGTFSETGPKKCSGLTITQYSASSMSALFEKDFDRVRCFNEDHFTPSNTTQNFQFCSFQKKP